ncbi:hypothetical protein ACSSS7_005393 [Eimeria intestinalis]
MKSGRVPAAAPGPKRQQEDRQQRQQLNQLMTLTSQPERKCTFSSSRSFAVGLSIYALFGHTFLTSTFYVPLLESQKQLNAYSSAPAGFAAAAAAAGAYLCCLAASACSFESVSEGSANLTPAAFATTAQESVFFGWAYSGPAALAAAHFESCRTSSSWTAQLRWRLLDEAQHSSLWPQQQQQLEFAKTGYRDAVLGADAATARRGKTLSCSFAYVAKTRAAQRLRGRPQRKAVLAAKRQGRREEDTFTCSAVAPAAGTCSGNC